MQPIQRFLILLTLLAFLQQCGLVEKKDDKGPRRKRDPRSCEEFRKTLPNDIEQGFLEVPEIPGDSTSRKLQVFYYGLLNGSHDDKDNVVFFNGGPGGDSHSSYEFLIERIRNEKMNFIFIDQRGNGCSTHYHNLYQPTRVELYAHWGTRGIVADAELVREHLFGKGSKWRVFGQSYGSRIVHRYLDSAPESVFSAHGHGFAMMDDSGEWMRLRVLSQKEVGQKFLEEFPEAVEHLRDAKKVLTNDICVDLPKETICGDAILDGFSIFLAFHDEWESLARILDNLSIKDGSKLVVNKKVMQWIQDFMRDETPSLSGDILGPYVASFIDRFGSEYYGLNGRRMAGCEETWNYLLESGHDSDEWVFSECRLAENTFYKPGQRQFGERESQAIDVGLSKIKHDPIRVKNIKRNLQERPDLRFFLYSGKLDPVVPPPTFQEEVERLGELVHYTEFEKTGHDGFGTEDKVWDDLRRPASEALVRE